MSGGAGCRDGRDSDKRQRQTAGERFGGIEQRAAADAYHHLTIVVAGVRQLGNMAFATMAGKLQMFCASTFKRFRQVRPGGGNRAFAVHPNGVGKLFRREKVCQSSEASGMEK